MRKKIMNLLFVASLLLITFASPSMLFALNQDRPFWTEKSCYVEGEVVYGVGVALNKHSLDEARKAAFNAGVWEIASFTQTNNTTSLFIETQMTYEEQNKDGTYSVWRLVKVPIEMLKDNIEKVREAELNWSKKLIRVKGYGVPNKNLPVPVQKLSAQEAAKVDAQTKLIEMVKGLKISSKTFIKNFQLQSDEKIKEIEGKIRGAYQIGETYYLPDGTAEIIMEVNVDDVF